MVAGAQAQFDMYKSEGKASKLIVQQAGADINQQIQDVRNMILQGVSVITMDPNSGTALDSVINEAKRAGIPVIAFDQAVQNRYALSVTIDHYTWATRYAEWVAKTLNGKGKVVVMDGIPGNPAAETRRRAAHDVFAKYPGIDIVWSGYGYWDQAKAQNVMATVIAAQPQIDGAFVEDSMGLGVLRAFQNARRPIPVMTAEAQKAFLLAWKQELASGTNMQAFAQPARYQPQRHRHRRASRRRPQAQAAAQQHDLLSDPSGGDARQHRPDPRRHEGQARQLLPGRMVLGTAA
jgi:ribose transport system substrate-binding protein